MLAAVKKAGLDEARAQEILASDEFAAEVRAAERHYQQAGISSVPEGALREVHQSGLITVGADCFGLRFAWCGFS